MSRAVFTADSWGARRAFSALSVQKSADGGQCLEGVIGTPHGFVRAYSYPTYSMLDFVWRGRQYRRTWKHGFTERGITTVAARFVREVLGSRS